jgi:branched-chain amino acid transport system ATP-binding protein
MAPAPETILATERLMMRFGGLFAVNELDLNVRQGSIHSIIGPNGAGKTTVFNCIMQNLQISAGRIWFRGERIDGLSPDLVAAAGVSRTHQNTIRGEARRRPTMRRSNSCASSG